MEDEKIKTIVLEKVTEPTIDQYELELESEGYTIINIEIENMATSIYRAIFTVTPP